MKTYKNLYPQITAFPNLYRSYLLARRGKRTRAAVADFELDVEIELINLSDELRQQTYRPGPYTSFYIFEPKKRLISAAPFRDRVVHHALCQIIEPIWECRFIDTNYACRIDKGTHKALDKAHHWVKQHRYAFHGDIVKYFPSIDYQILRGLLQHRLADGRVMWLVDVILANGTGVQAAETPHHLFPGDDLLVLTRPRGLPIGNLTSQFWANVYLHELDKFVKHKLYCPAYLRYMDDFVLFADDKQQLHEWKILIHQFLSSHLRLLMHPRKSVVFPTKVGLDFCGFRLFPTHRRLRRSTVRRFVRRFRHQRHALQHGEITLDEMHQSVRSWIAHAEHGDTWRLRERLFQDYPIRTAP
ncbi:MAG: RNA-dependent DNA polymerase [Chloroflexi bacterium]|nr:RNA-dependent DNA polymerase [Chloroflexota bacterium]